MNSTKKQARIAGFLYLLVVFVAPFGQIYVPSRLIVRGDAAATASRILASETLFRLGIAAQLLSAIIFLSVVLALYTLFKGVNERTARLMLTFVVVGVSCAFLNVLNDIAALIIFSGPDFLSVFDKRQLDALGYTFVRIHGQGSNVASIIWGLWLFPFGSLVMRSGFIPRWLGVSLMIAGLGYLVGAFTEIVSPQVARLIDPVAMVLYFGELPIILWLLIWGAKEQRSAATAA